MFAALPKFGCFFIFVLFHCFKVQEHSVLKESHADCARVGIECDRRSEMLLKYCESVQLSAKIDSPFVMIYVWKKKMQMSLCGSAPNWAQLHTVTTFSHRFLV